MLLNNNNSDPLYASHKKAAQKFAVQYLITIILTVVLLSTITLLVWSPIENLRMYKPEEYRIASSLFKYGFAPCMILLMIAVCVYTTYRYMLRPLKCLEELALAAKCLASPTEAPIYLSEDLKDIENDLNAVRERAIESKKSADDAVRRKNDLLIYLAHDLKTPLSSVIGYTKLLKDVPAMPAEQIAQYAGIAYTKAERLEELINEFFEITRFSTNSLTITPVSVNLSRMLTQIANEFNPILAQKCLRWDLDIKAGIEIPCDPNKIERAIDNLVRNAVNYSFKNSTVHFRLWSESDTVKIMIQNSGKTIPKEKLGRIFELFYRVDDSRSGYTGGAGIGLAIAKEVIELHGGTITADSADDAISFSIELPMDCHKKV